MTYHYNGKAAKNSTIILLLGNLGIRSLIETAVTYQYNVEVWTYEDEEEPALSNVSIRQLGPLLDTFTY